MRSEKPRSRSRGDALPDARGELQRRVGAILEAGADRNLSRSSLRVFLRCRQWASFDRCTFHVSLRTLARALGGGIEGKGEGGMSSAHRGLQGLIDAGIIRQREETVAGCRVFEIVVPRSLRPSIRRDDRGEEPPWE
jgi:hypothetical protein